MVGTAYGCADRNDGHGAHTDARPASPPTGNDSDAGPVPTPGVVSMPTPTPTCAPPGTTPEPEQDSTCHLSDVPPVDREICLGGADIELQGAIYPFSEAPGFTTRNGNAFLAIDGSCNYWVRPSQRLREARTGTLSREDAERILDELRFSEWEGWYERLGPLSVADGSVTLLWDETSGFGCQNNCGQEWTPQPGYECMVSDWAPLFEAFTNWVDTLYELGSPVAGPMRVRAWSFLGDPTKEDPMTMYEWPATTPIEQLASADQASAPLGGTAVEGADADALRALRNRARDYYEAPGSTLFQSWIIIPAEPTAYFVELDDALPIEAADGIIPRPSLNLRPPGL